MKPDNHPHNSRKTLISIGVVTRAYSNDVDVGVVDSQRARWACQESCVGGRLQLNLLLCGEPFAEHDGELRLGGGPFAWRHLPLAADLAQHQEQQLGCRFVIGEVARAVQRSRLGLVSPKCNTLMQTAVG